MAWRILRMQIQPDWGAVDFFNILVIPAEDGTHKLRLYKGFWVPAFAGMSGK